MSAWDAVQQVASYVGTGGTALATHVYTLLRKARADAAEARKQSAATAASLTTLTASVGELARAYDEAIKRHVENIALEVAKNAFAPYRTLPANLRREVDEFKQETETIIGRLTRPSRPDLLGIEEVQRQLDEVMRRQTDLSRRLEELRTDFGTLRTDMGTERSARHALAREVQQRHAEVMRSWGEIKGVLGEIMGRFQVLMDQWNDRDRIDRNDRGRRG